jgi:hypothetical protein
MIPSFSGRGMSALNAPTVSRFTSRSSEGANISHIEPRNSKPISGYTISFFRCCNCFGVSGLAVFFSFFPPPLSSFFPFPVSGAAASATVTCCVAVAFSWFCSSIMSKIYGCPTF